MILIVQFLEWSIWGASFATIQFMIICYCYYYLIVTNTNTSFDITLSSPHQSQFPNQIRWFFTWLEFNRVIYCGIIPYSCFICTVRLLESFGGATGLFESGIGFRFVFWGTSLTLWIGSSNNLKSSASLQSAMIIKKIFWIKERIFCTYFSGSTLFW